MNNAEPGHSRRSRPATSPATDDRVLREVLDRALAVARVVMHADGAALWLAPDAGQSARVLQTGVEDDVVEQLMELPGRQLQGAVGTPVLVRGRRAAHLYLLGVDPCDALRDRGTAMPVLASMISTAVADQRAVRAGSRRLDWALAAARLGGEIASDGGPDPVDRVLQRAVGTAGAEQGVVVEIAPHDAVVTAFSGSQDAPRLGSRVPLAGTAVERVATSGWAVLLDGGGHGPDVMAPLAGACSAVFVPLRLTRGAVTSVIGVGRSASSPSYTHDDVNLFQDFGAQAGGVLEAVSSTADRPETPAQHVPVAALLDDAVVRSLFSVGLELAALVQMTSAPETRRRLERSIGTLDAAVDDVRTCILELQRGRSSPPNARPPGQNR